jgi:hypothetical protein
MKPSTRHAFLAALSLAALAACDDPAKKLAAAAPATGQQLQEFSRTWNDPIDLGRDVSLLQRFCMNESGATCQPNMVEQVKQYGLKEGSTTSDLAFAFITMVADRKDGTVDHNASDENFVHSCYRVMFGREPDAEGAAHHLGNIGGKGEDARRALAMDFLRSPEFNSQH